MPKKIKLFYSGVYSKHHSVITKDNIKCMLADDVRSRLVDNIDDVLYASSGVITKNHNVVYIGGFYYEYPIEGMSETETVVAAELKQIEQSDIVVANLLGHAAIGSVAELFYAAKKGKRIEVFIKNVDTAFDVVGEYWFPLIALKHLNANITVHKVDSNDDVIDFIMGLK